MLEPFIYFYLKKKKKNENMNESYMLHELKEGPLQICIFRNFIIESLFNNMYYINIYKCVC